MKITNKIIVLILMVGCGAPPSSNDEETTLGETLKENVTSLGHSNCPTDDSQDTHQLVCPEGKLCPGMTKQAVIELLGDPDEVFDPGHSHINEWRYEPESGHCTTEHIFCSVNFVDNLLDTQENISPALLDLMADW